MDGYLYDLLISEAFPVNMTAKGNFSHSILLEHDFV